MILIPPMFLAFLVSVFQYENVCNNLLVYHRSITYSIHNVVLSTIEDRMIIEYDGEKRLSIICKG